MNYGQTLFDPQVKTLCHKGDPDTSKEAAQMMVKSGKLSEKRRIVLSWIREYCRQGHADFTAKEVAGGINAKYFDIQRRKNELAELGYIEKTGEIRVGCEVWRLKK